MKYRKILVFPDFCSSGLWNGNDQHHVMIDYEELGLPEWLINAFRHWIYGMYDDGYKRDYSGLTKKAVKPVYYEGLRLAHEIKRILPNTEVEYWGELGNCKLKKTRVKLT